MDSVLKFLIKLQADGDNVVTVARRTSEQLDEISNKARRVSTRLREAFSFSNFKSSLMSVPGMEFLTNPYTMAAGAIGAITKIGAEAEQTSVAFTTLVGSESKAKEMLDEITKFAATSPFGRLDLTKNAQTMLNFGVETGRVIPLLKQLGDISGGNKDHMNGLSLVLGQVSAAGKLAGQDLLQFINAGWNPLQDLSQMTGKSMGVLKEMMSKGQITFENVTQAMEHATSQGGLFFGMMEKQSQTTLGKWSNLQDNIQMSMVNMFSQVKSPINDLLDLVNSSLPNIAAFIESLFGHFVSGIKFIIQYRTEFSILTGVIASAWGISKVYTTSLMVYHGVVTGISVATKTWAVVQQFLNAAFVASPIGWIILAVGALATGVIYCWNKFAGFRAFILTMWGTIAGFGNIIKTYVINRFNEMLSGIGKLGEALKRLFNGDFKGAASSALEGYKKLSGAGSALNAARQTRDLVTGLRSDFSRNYAKESAKDRASSTSTTKKDNKIAHPKQKGSAREVIFGSATGGAKGGRTGGGRSGGGRKSAEEIATGGTRNTSVNLSIGKFFENLYVTMTDKTDTAELERVILESMNRALAIATSADR